MSPVANQDMHLHLTPGELDFVENAIELWMEAIEAIPVLMIGTHIPTGGLVVIPIQDRQATSRRVVDILEETIAYIKKSDPTLRG